MFPHPNTVFEVRALQNRDLLRNAAQERRASEATKNVQTPSWKDRGHAYVHRVLAWIAAIDATPRRSWRLARS